MTNEHIAALIGEGGNDELLPLLWEKMLRFYRMAALKYAQLHKNRCAQCGITYEDILQESYFAMLDGIKAYNERSPEQTTLHFISFCGFPFRNCAAALIGIRTKAQRAKPLNNAVVSLDESIQSDEADGNTAMIELIPDETAEEPFREIEQADYCREIRDTVQAALSEQPRELDVIEHIYYGGNTLSDTGAALGVSTERVRQLRQRALRRLYKNNRLRELYDLDPYRHVSVRQFRRNGSIVEQTAERHERYCTRMQELAEEEATFIASVNAAKHQKGKEHAANMSKE